MTQYLLSEFVDILDGALNSQDSEMIDLVRERAVKAAMEKYSVDKPGHYTEDVTGNDTHYYDLATLLAYWGEDVGFVERIQFPATSVASNGSPVYLDPKDWNDSYWDETTRYLYLPHHQPTTAQTMRVEYRMPHIWTVSTVATAVEQADHGFSANDYVINRSGTWASVSTIRTATHQVSAVADTSNFTAKIIQVDIPAVDFYAVCHLSSSIACRELATRYAAMGDSYVRTALSSTQIKTSEYSRRADEYLEMYEKHIGLGDGLIGAGTYVAIGIPEHATLQRVWRRPIT